MDSKQWHGLTEIMNLISALDSASEYAQHMFKRARVVDVHHDAGQPTISAEVEDGEYVIIPVESQDA